MLLGHRDAARVEGAPELCAAAVAAWIWALALTAGISAAAANSSGTSTAPLAIWRFGAAHFVRSTFSWPGAVLMMGAAFAIGALAAWPAQLRGENRVAVAVSGASGPLVVAAAYFLATPKLVGAQADEQLSAFLVEHGRIPALGFRIGDAAYTPDLHDIPQASWPSLQNLDLWIVDGLRYAAHSSHFSVSDALGWIERFKPKRAVITNMHSDLDYEVLRQSLPAGVIPAYDGMQLVLDRIG